MKDLIEYIAKSLVDHPEEVQVRENGRKFPGPHRIKRLEG